MFTNIGQLAAFLAIAVGAIAIVASFFVAPDMMAPEIDRLSLKQSALWLRQGSTLVFCGLVLGILSEISRKLGK